MAFFRRAKNHSADLERMLEKLKRISGERASPDFRHSPAEAAQSGAAAEKLLIPKELAAIRSSIVQVSQSNMAEEKESLLVTYSLPRKSRSEKMLFNYELVGRNGKEGLLQRLGGKKVTPGCVIIPQENEGEMCEFLARHGIDFGKQKIIVLE